MDAILRQWHILRSIPNYPRRIDIRTLHRNLNDLSPEMQVSRRTIERDLQKLSTLFELVADDHRPQGRSLLQEKRPTCRCCAAAF